MDALVSIILSLPNVGAYAIFGLGIVVIYQTSRILNLAHGAQAMLCAYLYLALTDTGIPPFIALLLGIVAGGVLGYGVERIFVRPLRSVSATAQTVGTVAAFGLLVAIASRIWGTGGNRVPGLFPEGQLSIGRSFITYGQIGLFVVMLVVAGGLFAFLKFTDFGLAMRGTADNRRASSLMGIDPDLATSAAWVLGGATAALAGILLAAASSLHPVVMSLQAIPAFVATLIGGMASLPGALIGAGIVGVAQGLSPVLPFTKNLAGGPQVILTIVAFVVMAMRGQTLVAGDVRSASAIGGGADDAAPRPRRRSRSMLGLALVALAFPWLPFVSFSILGRANLAAEYSLVAISLVVLTGWVGQVSLGQAAFVGVGAYVTGLAQGAWGIGFPVNLVLGAVAGAATAALLGVVALRVRGLYLAVATLIFSWTADVFLFQQEWLTRHSFISVEPIGDPGAIPYLDFTSRRTFYYAIWAAVALAILMLSNLRDRKIGRAFFAVRGSEMATASLGIDVVRTKLVAFAVSGALAGVAGSFILVGSQTVTPDQFSLSTSLFFLAIAVVGGLTSLGGAVAAAALFAGLEEIFFRFPAVGDYLQLVTIGLLIAVLLGYPGGLAAFSRMLGRRMSGWSGPLTARIRQEIDAWRELRAKPEEPAIEAVDIEVAASEPTVERDPFVAPSWLRPVLSLFSRPLERLQRAREVRQQAALALQSAAQTPVWTIAGDDATDAPLEVPSTNGDSGHDTADAPVAPTWETMEIPRPTLSAADRASRRPLIETDSITVRFGGLTAVNGASLTVREGEIVGLIGPNGAGKTTLFNSIAGFNSPAEGRILLHGIDVSAFPVYMRSRLGVARTFQAIQLFPQLTVFDNLLVATYVSDRSGLASSMVMTYRSLQEEARSRQLVHEVVRLLGLEEVADRPVSGLPFGVLRMVEIARALVTGAPVVMLDEPASGLDDVETERLSRLIHFIRSLGVTVLLIEHDVAMVTGISDYMYVLDQGTLIAEGTPADIKRNPDVIAAYLGEAPDADEEPAGALAAAVVAQPAQATT